MHKVCCLCDKTPQLPLYTTIFSHFIVSLFLCTLAISQGTHICALGYSVNCKQPVISCLTPQILCNGLNLPWDLGLETFGEKKCNCYIIW